MTDSIELSEIKIGRRFRTEQGDISRLCKSIEEVGLLHPIVISEDKELIAGFRRIEAFKALGRNSIPFHTVNLKEVSKGEIQENAVRKDFTVSEMVAVKRALEPEMLKEAEERKKSGKPSSKLDAGRTDEKIAKYLGVGKDTLRKAEALVVASEKAPEKFASILEKVDSGKRTISNMAVEVERWESTQNIQPIMSSKEMAITLRNQDFSDANIEPNSIDMILTDVPYPKEYEYLYGQLGNLAQRVLKPGGWLITYCGHYQIPYVTQTFGRFLSYDWIFSVVMKNVHARIRDYGVCWKPMVVYYKEPRIAHERLDDLFVNDKQEKRFHEWGQGIGVFKYILEKFSAAESTILEPMAGGGSTIQACIETKRNCIAYEINPDTFAILKKRFPDAKLE